MRHLFGLLAGLIWSLYPLYGLAAGQTTPIATSYTVHSHDPSFGESGPGADESPLINIATVTVDELQSPKPLKRAENPKTPYGIRSAEKKTLSKPVPAAAARATGAPVVAGPITASAARFQDKACKALYQNLARPKLRSDKVAIAHYTDIGSLPRLKTMCTNNYDTGIPDLKTCTLVQDSCASQWHGPFGTWGCISGYTNKCTNVIMCNTWANYKSTMECDVQVQLKLPNFIEKPLSDYIDQSYRILDKTRDSLPLACVPAEIKQNTVVLSGEQIAQAVSRQVQKQIREEVEREAKQWLQDTAVTTIVAAIPSGGIGGAAAMATSLSTFVYRTYKAVEPVVRYMTKAKDFAEDLGFSTSCGWNEYTKY